MPPQRKFQSRFQHSFQNETMQLNSNCSLTATSISIAAAKKKQQHPHNRESIAKKRSTVLADRLKEHEDAAANEKRARIQVREKSLLPPFQNRRARRQSSAVVSQSVTQQRSSSLSSL